MREAIARLLDASGVENTTFASAEALLAGGAQEDAACVVSDLRLPAMSGFELLAELRARGGGPPLILITAHDAPGQREEAARLAQWPIWSSRSAPKSCSMQSMQRVGRYLAIDTDADETLNLGGTP